MMLRRLLPPVRTYDDKRVSARRFFTLTKHLRSENFDSDRRIFEYTSGRWIFNETVRLTERRLAFDVTELARVIANSAGKPLQDVRQIEKLAEGGFNRILKANMADGSQVLARLPYPSTQPPRYSVASEVATLKFLRQQCIPVPKILSYSANARNSVGSEYIIMEKMTGQAMGDRWFNLTERERAKILLQLVKIEARLLAIDLPAYGSIFHPDELESNMPRIEIPSRNDVESYCIGPSTELQWWYKKRAGLNIQRGPFTDPADLLLSAANKELECLAIHEKPRLAVERAYRELLAYKPSLPSDHAETLKKFMAIAPYLVPTERALHRPMLLHPDLQPNNIFVSDDLEITGIIDWQGAAALPLFLAARIPKHIQNYQDEESLRFVVPKLADNIDRMEDNERDSALESYRRRHLHFFYLAFSQKYNPTYWQALDFKTGLLRRKTISHALEPWEANNVPLKADLVHISNVWPYIREADQKEPDECPISFGEQEAEETLRLKGFSKKLMKI